DQLDSPDAASSSPSMGMKTRTASDQYTLGPADCSSMEYWDVAMNMPMPFPMAHMLMSVLMLHGYSFSTAIAEEGVARGRADFSIPNMFMADLGTSVGDTQYVNLDIMLTAELWTVPKGGTPELFQIGENKADGTPFLDAQHPHSSPLMGLTLSDTLALGEDKSNLKLFFAPRGESTDGPIAFMHRVTGVVNPDAPLGHHVGQDVGHVSSTVLGESLKLGSLHFEASAFHGMESQPTQVDLPIGLMDSWAFRLIGEFSPQVMAMVSYAYVNQPEPGITNAERISASLYTHTALSTDWTWHNTLVYGFITHIDNAPNLSSVLYEFLLNNSKINLFGRVETLQRTPNQLQIPGLPNPDSGRWVTAITLGLSGQVVAWDGWELRSGFSVSNDQTPAEYSVVYEGNPITYKFFLELDGMQMTNL
ncbi:MAG TPA: hypothetical protein VIJ93_08115, partial [bacterium]